MYSDFVSKFVDQKKSKPKFQITQCKNYGLNGHAIEKCFKELDTPKLKTKVWIKPFNKRFSSNSTTDLNPESSGSK